MPPDVLVDIARAGNRLATLRALRDRLAASLDDCDSKRDEAALALRLTDVLEQIDTLEKAEPAREGTGLDEFTRKLAERRPTAGVARPARGRQ